MGPGWTFPARIWSEEQDEDTQEPLLLQQKQAKLRPNPCVTAVAMRIGMSLLQLPLELQVSLLEISMGAWDTAAIILTASMAQVA